MVYELAGRRYCKAKLSKINEADIIVYSAVTSIVNDEKKNQIIIP